MFIPLCDMFLNKVFFYCDFPVLLAHVHHCFEHTLVFRFIFISIMLLVLYLSSLRHCLYHVVYYFYFFEFSLTIASQDSHKL